MGGVVDKSGSIYGDINYVPPAVNYSATAAPTSAVLSASTPGYTTLGGSWQFASVSASENDFILFAYQVPLTSPSKVFYTTHFRVDTFDTGAAIATTSTSILWSIAVNGTTSSLKTGGFSVYPCGVQAFLTGAAIGAGAPYAVDVVFQNAKPTSAGNYIGVVVRIPIGTSTSSEVVRGACLIEGFYGD